MKLLACILILSCVSCTQWKEAPEKKQDVIYTSSWQDKWKQEMLDRCNKEVAVLSIAIYEGKMQAGKVMTKEEFEALNKMLSDSCVKHYRIMI